MCSEGACWGGRTIQETAEHLNPLASDQAVLRLIRRYLQGGLLSPLLANVLLDEVDRELERRGHRFVRYADDYTKLRNACAPM